MTQPANMFMNFDKRGAEWVITAYYSQDENMIDVVESGRDPHIATAHLATGVPEVLLHKEAKAVELENDPQLIEKIRRRDVPELYEEDWFLPRTMSARQCYKKANHGLNYDMRAQRAGLEWEMDYTEANRVVDGYHRAYPMIRKGMHRGIERQLNKDRTLVNCYGSKRRFLDSWGDKLLRDAYAYIPQSTNVDLVDEAMCLIYEDQSTLMEPIQLRFEVHDSLMVQVPVGDWQWCAQAVAQIYKYMTPTLEYWDREFVIETDLKLGPNAGRMIEVPIVHGNDNEMARRLKRAWKEAA